MTFLDCALGVSVGSMNANDKSLDAIFGMTRQLVVPLFQRPYVCTEEENWEPLWESVREVAERRLRQEAPWPHFLGAIVLDLLPYATGDVESRQVIDGQQRVTILQLLLAAIRDFAQDNGATDFATAFQDLTRNKVPGSESEQDEFKVWPTNRDRDVFVKVMKAGSPDAVKRAFGFRTNAKRSPQLVEASKRRSGVPPLDLTLADLRHRSTVRFVLHSSSGTTRLSRRVSFRA